MEDATIFRKKMLIALTVAAVFWGTASAWHPAVAGNAPSVICNADRLSVECFGEPLLSLLEKVSDATRIDVFVSENLKPEPVHIRLADCPIEDAIRRILRGYNYAAVYTREGDAWRISALRIYPDGENGGTVVPVKTKKTSGSHHETGKETREVWVQSGADMIVDGALGNHGRLVPSRIRPVPSSASGGPLPPWFSLQKQFDHIETMKYQELLLHQQKMESVSDPEKKEALSLVYADEVEKFHIMKKEHLNQIEAIKRFSNLREMTQTAP